MNVFKIIWFLDLMEAAFRCFRIFCLSDFPFLPPSSPLALFPVKLLLRGVWIHPISSPPILSPMLCNLTSTSIASRKLVSKVARGLLVLNSSLIIHDFPIVSDSWQLPVSPKCLSLSDFPPSPLSGSL